MPEVPPEQTALSSDQLRTALHGGHVLVFGEPPGDGRLGYAWSVARLETGGRGWNHNLGNIKATPSWKDAGHLWTTIPVPPPEPPEQRAYETAEDGAADWWRLLDRPRYAGVLELADEGRAYEAAYLMGERGYYTAPKDRYSKEIMKLYDKYRATWPAPASQVAAPVGSLWSKLVAMALGGSAAWWAASRRPWRR